MIVFKVADLTEQLASKTDADDAIMVAVDNKIEEWKVIRLLFYLTLSISIYEIRKVINQEI